LAAKGVVERSVEIPVLNQQEKSMNADKLESTGTISLNKKGTSAHDFNELSDQKLQLVIGGGSGRCPVVCCPPGQEKKGLCP
jgi:bacteriocin-like protein